MQRRTKKHLFDVERQAEAIARFLHEKTYEDFLADEVLRAAIERKFEILGEALNRIAKDAPEVAAQIADYRRIISFRNILAHDYDNARDELIWANATERLPSLRAEVGRLLAS